MAGFKQRFKVQFQDGTIRTVVAQSHTGAKRAFVAGYQPAKGSWLTVWPMGDEGNKRRMRV
jgi:hypothetical protein